MKVKILSSKSPMWWYYKLIGSEIYVNYFIDDSIDRYHHPVDKLATINTNDAVITELPESFCVKRCDDKEKWEKYIQWLNKTCKNDFSGNAVNLYYGLNEGGGWNAYMSFGTEIHIDDIIKHIDYMKIKDSITVKYENGKFIEVKEERIMETQKLSRQDLKEIHSVACSEWKQKLVTYVTRKPLEDYIELTQEEVNQMFDACTKEQLPIVSKYLKKEDDGSVDVTEFNTNMHGFCDNNYYVIRDRQHGSYSKKSFLLSSQYNWEIKKDELGELCLIPTKKK